MKKNPLAKIGEVYETPQCLVFFGWKKATLEQLLTKYPDARLLKQVHGDKLVFSSPEVVEADAHWTRDKQLPLLIKTADCLPIMIHSPRENLCVAIHAGWRGVQKKITSNSIGSLKLMGDPGLKVWIGPHIQLRSFVVDQDVAEAILDSHFLKWQDDKMSVRKAEFAEFAKVMPDEAVVVRHEKKFQINLAWLVLWELFLCGVKPSQVTISADDTKSNDLFHSYRRGEKNVRNYNFILLK